MKQRRSVKHRLVQKAERQVAAKRQSQQQHALFSFRAPCAKTTGGEQIGWAVGDKASHQKWGVGTVVSVKGEGDAKELDIAFPSPIGVKRLLAKFAPVTKQ